MLSCFFEDSEEPVDLRHAVVDALIIDGRKILLVKRDKVLVYSGKWCLPGGFIERNETLAFAAKREAEEETGYQVKIKSLFRVIDSPKRRHEPSQNVAFEYLAVPIKKIGNHDQEVSEIRWFDFDYLPSPHDIAFDHLETIKLYINQI